MKKIPVAVRLLVEEVTLDFSDSMHQIVSACFPKVMITFDRFHHQQFCLEALLEMCIGHCYEVMTEIANARDEFRAMIRDQNKNSSFSDLSIFSANSLSYASERLYFLMV